MNQYDLIDNVGDQIWYLDTEDRSADVLSGSVYSSGLCWHRTDGPAIIYASGTQEWYVNGKCHRLDGPAYIGADGTQYWYRKGRFHRAEGPAIITANGGQSWYVNGIRYDNNKSFQKAAVITDEEMTFLIVKYGNVK